MTAFFAWHRKHQKIIFPKSKSRNKNPEHVFVDFILFFNIAVEKFGKKVFGLVGDLERNFSMPRMFQFWVQIFEIW